MSTSTSARQFWEEFCRSKPEIDPSISFQTCQTWFFGNTPEMALELAGLVLSGKKTATASLMDVNEKKPEAAPVPDGYSIVTDFEGRPMCVIQTTEIRHLPFNEVDEQFAFDEGEGDRSLEYWRDDHRRYFTAEAAENGITFNERSLVCCERFRLLFPG